MIKWTTGNYHVLLPNNHTALSLVIKAVKSTDNEAEWVWACIRVWVLRVLAVVGTEVGAEGDSGTGMNWWVLVGEFEGKGHHYIHKQRACFVHSRDEMKISQAN